MYLFISYLIGDFLLKRINLIGQKFGKLTVVENIYNFNETGKTKYKCVCDCGNPNYIYKTKVALEKSTIPSCGCARKEISKIYFGKNIDGDTFGRLTVIKTLWESRPTRVLCRCSCDGNIAEYDKKSVETGHTKSCGCINKERMSSIRYKDYSGYISDYGVKIIKPTKKNKNNQQLWLCECGLCGTTFEELPAKICNGHIKSCGCLNSSQGESFIEKFLLDNNIRYQKQYTFDDCKSKNNYVLRFDFAIFDDDNKLILLIEYDGKQHFEPIDFFGGEKGFSETKNRDDIKNKYCLNNNICLLRLPYTMTNNEIQEKIINTLKP